MNTPQKFPIGTRFQTLKPIHKDTGTAEIMPGAYFIVVGFGPGVFQPAHGRKSYYLRHCSKDGNKLYRYSDGWDQEAMETNLVNGLFRLA